MIVAMSDDEYYQVFYLLWKQAGLQALHFAAKTGDTEILSLLIKYGAPINATSKVYYAISVEP